MLSEWILASISFVLLVCLVVLYNAFVRFKKNTLEEIQLYIENHNKEVKQVYNDIRGWRHDFHNHLQTMKAHVSLKQYTKLSKYVEDLHQSMIDVDVEVKTGNMLLDALLSAKLAIAKKYRIDMNVSATAKSDLTVSEVDLSIIIGNLFDNAVESCLKVPERNRFIRLYIGSVKQQLYISITNATKENKKNHLHQYVTEKIGSHGHGLRRIDSTVKKYGGYTNRQNEPNLFVTEIFLPL